MIMEMWMCCLWLVRRTEKEILFLEDEGKKADKNRQDDDKKNNRHKPFLEERLPAVGFVILYHLRHDLPARLKRENTPSLY